jgi:hypothetical protein
MKRIVFALAALLLPAATPAQAAPQILGLVATAEPVPLQCDGGQCTAFLSAFCLQKKRLLPDLRTAYRPAPGSGVTLVLTAGDGATRRLDASGLVEFRTAYGYTAVRVELAQGALAAWAPVSVAIEVGPRAALLPVPIAGDPDPLSDEEIALATGPWRLAAQAVFEGGSAAAGAARTTARLANALPASGDIAAHRRQEFWDRIATADAPPLARRTFDACGRTVDQSIGYSLRTCLEERHELLQTQNTKTYWESLGGS